MCAAPSSAYRTEKLHDGTTNANSVKADIAIPSVAEATLKTRFYLDWILSTEKDGVGGFVGGCTIGSTNDAMHNTARHWTGRSRGPAGQNIRWFNDAGLNTLGICSLAAQGFVTLWANYIRAHITFTSAWYVNTDQFGFEWRVPAGTWNRVRLTPPSSIPQQQTVTSIWRLPGGMVPNTTYQFRFYITNAEGTYLSAAVTQITDDYIYEEIFQVRSVACTLTVTDQKLFLASGTREAMSNLTGTPVTGDLYAWTEETFTTQPAPGWYFSYDDGYSYYYDSNFGFTQRQFCVPVPTIKVNLNITIFEAGYWTVMANNITGTPFGSNITITGTAVGSMGGSPVANVPFSVTINAGQMSGSNSGPHSADFVSQLDWTAGGFSSSNTNVVANNEINALVGIG